MAQHMTAIERRNRYEVEHAEHDIDHHHREYKLAQRDKERICVSKSRALECAEDDLLSGGRSGLYKNQNQHGAAGHHKIADRPDYRSENVNEHRVLEVSRI